MKRRSIHALVIAGALLLFALPARTAGTDVAAQEKILKTSDDFRFRVDACLRLGASGDFKARKPLEYALEDPHPTVRQAAASGLAKLGDVLAVPALEARESKEKNAPTKTAIGNAITSLKTSAPTSAGTIAGVAPDWGKTKFIVKLQRIANDSGVRGDKLAAVLEGSTRAKLAAIPGVFVLPSDSAATPIMVQAATKGVPVLGVDCKVVMLDQATFAGDLKIQAKVSYAISKTQVIKSAIEGNASSIGSLSSAKNPLSLIKLQDMAVDGAVASAMGKAPSALAAAIK